MRWARLGERAVVLRELPRPAHEIAAAIRAARVPDVLEAIASYETVGIYLSKPQFDVDKLLTAAQTIVDIEAPANRMIPCCYEMGADLDSVAEQCGVTREYVVALHSSSTYRCFAVGFCPGFPYLGYLPEPLGKTRRRDEPRTLVEAGSVAIARDQAGIYPLDIPGGWNLIGRTPLTLVDVEDDYFPIRAGDTVTFFPIGESEYRALIGQRL